MNDCVAHCGGLYTCFMYKKTYKKRNVPNSIQKKNDGVAQLNQVFWDFTLIYNGCTKVTKTIFNDFKIYICQKYDHPNLIELINLNIILKAIKDPVICKLLINKAIPKFWVSPGG